MHTHQLSFSASLNERNYDLTNARFVLFTLKLLPVLIKYTIVWLIAQSCLTDGYEYSDVTCDWL